ncbi:UNVERIFIED_CONTAM: hypothetical protein Sangu_1305900 [Sesamum angustifolium]|uniref:Uncharacterized protein n=1 Tax=Sesamum angustifolium TaxID=2727405 RepID=A0AAW2NMQ1_9LAMI
MTARHSHSGRTLVNPAISTRIHDPSSCIHPPARNHAYHPHPPQVPPSTHVPHALSPLHLLSPAPSLVAVATPCPSLDSHHLLPSHLSTRHPSVRSQLKYTSTLLRYPHPPAPPTHSPRCLPPRANHNRPATPLPPLTPHCYLSPQPHSHSLLFRRSPAHITHRRVFCPPPRTSPRALRPFVLVSPRTTIRSQRPHLLAPPYPVCHNCHLSRNGHPKTNNPTPSRLHPRQRRPDNSPLSCSTPSHSPAPHLTSGPSLRHPLARPSPPSPPTSSHPSRPPPAIYLHRLQHLQSLPLL